MIDKERIEEAATKYAGKRPKDLLTMERQAFMDGAQWVQQEFVNSLWHDAREKPKQHKMIVAITGGMDSLTNFDAEVYNFPFALSKGDWADLVDQDGIMSWCYLSDLLPKEGGEK